MHASPPATLEHLAVGARAVVRAIAPEQADRLGAEGLHVGDEVEVEARLPLGGPLVVVVGRTRLALARVVAAGVELSGGEP